MKKIKTSIVFRYDIFVIAKIICTVLLIVEIYTFNYNVFPVSPFSLYNINI